MLGNVRLMCWLPSVGACKHVCVTITGVYRYKELTVYRYKELSNVYSTGTGIWNCIIINVYLYDYISITVTIIIQGLRM